MKIVLVRLKNQPILRQLELEEALLRADDRHFCILNEGSTPACVLGISSKVEEMVHVERVQIPLIRRFSGGGTVVVDENTCFSTFILNASHNPETLHHFAATFYAAVFQDLPFSLHENDYRLDDKKMGGNAQYFTKSRSLHHTSFLFDWDQKRMELLKMPPKRPIYRQDRGHAEFLIPLKRYFPSRVEILNRMESVLREHFDVEEQPLSALNPILQKSYRKSIRLEDLAIDAGYQKKDSYN